MGDRRMIYWSREAELRFVETVSMLLGATLTVNEALHAAGRMRSLGVARRVAEVAAIAHSSGLPISDTLRAHLKRMDPVHYSVWQAFDDVGTTDPLVRAVGLMRSWQGLRGRIVTALIYPACVIVLITIGVAILASRVLPSISGSLGSFGVEFEPYITRVTTSAHVYLLMILGFALFAALVIVARRSDRSTLSGIRTASDWIGVTFPIVRRLTLLRSLFCLATTAAAVCDGGGTVEEGLSSGVAAIPNGFVRGQCRRAMGHVTNGTSISDSFRVAAGVRGIAVRWLDLLDQGSHPAAVFAGLVQYVQSALELVASRVSAAIEPVTVGVAGMVVVILVVNLILPLIDMYGGLIP